MPLVLRPPGTIVSLPDQLQSLGDHRKRVELAGGALRWVALLVVCLGIAGGLDVAYNLPSVVRGLFLLSTLGLAGTLALRDIFGPLRQPVKPLRVAHLLESKFPFNDALASAVEFSSLDADHQPASARFRKIAIARAKNALERHAVRDIIPSGRAWRAFWFALIACAVVAPLAAMQPERTKQAAIRFFDPFGAHPWPTKTQIRILHPEPVPYRLAKGDALEIHYRISGVLPDKVTVNVRFDSGTGFDEIVNLPKPDGHTGPIDHVFKLEPHRIPRHFEYQLTANDGSTEWRSVEVLPPPKLVPLEGRASPQMSLSFPRYTELPGYTLPDGASAVEAVHGTRIHFRAAADRRIATASFVPQFERDGLKLGASVAQLAGSNPFAVLGSQLLADHVPQDIPVAVVDGTRLEADFTPRMAGLYQLRFTDETGLTGVRLFEFRYSPDPAPAVSMDRPLAGQDPQYLLPTARVTVQARAEDRTFAVQNLVLEYRFGDASAPARTLPLARAGDAATASQMALIGATPAARSNKPLTLNGAAVIPLNRFTKPDGTPPTDGDTLLIAAAGTDFDDLTALKEPGRSKPAFEIRIVGRIGLDGLLQQELAKIRPDVLKLREEQRAARERTDDVRKATEQGTLNPEDAAKLMQAERDQRNIQNRIADSRDGLKAQAQKLQDLIKANQLPRSPTTDRVDAVADDLNRIADQLLDPIDQALARAKMEAEQNRKPDAAKIAGDAKAAVKDQKATEAALERTLQQLERWAGPGEVRAEALDLKNKVNQAGEQANKTTDKIEPGKPAEQLQPSEKAELQRNADKFNQLADRAAAALGKAERLAQEKDSQAKDWQAKADAKANEAKAAQAEADQQPKGSDAKADAQLKADAARADADELKKKAKQAEGEAAALRDAVQKAGGQELVEDLRGAGRELQQNNAAQANEAKQSAAEKLAKLAESLGEKPTAGDDELKKKKQTADDVDKLAAEQDELRKKTKAAQMIPDEAKRQEELAKLAREQERLKRKTEQAAEKLERERQADAAEKLRAAAEKMDAAAKDLQSGMPPMDKQDEALQKLDEAVNKLDREREKDAENLSAEKREELAQQLKALRERIAAADREATRIQTVTLKEMTWDRARLASLGDLEDRTKAIAGELRGFAEKQLEPLPVFRQLTDQAAKLLEQSGKLFAERKADALDNAGQPFDANAEQAVDERTRRPLKTALRRIDHILESIQEKPQPMPMGGTPMPGGTPEVPGGGGDMPPMPEMPKGGVPPLAQLKALRAIQAEVNERTAVIAKHQPDKTKRTDADREELEELERTQRDIAELLETIAPAFQPMMPDPEKK